MEIDSALCVAGAVCALGFSAAGSAIGIGKAACAAIGAWKKCYAQNKPAPYILFSYVGAPLTQTLYGMVLMFSILGLLTPDAGTTVLPGSGVAAMPCCNGYGAKPNRAAKSRPGATAHARKPQARTWARASRSNSASSGSGAGGNSNADASQSARTVSPQTSFPRASAAIPRIYRVKFHRDIYKDLQALEKAIGDNSEAESNMDMFSLEMFENIAFVMAKHADPTIPDTPEEWLDRFNTFSIYQVLPQIIELWGLNVQTDVQSKKNFEQLSGK